MPVSLLIALALVGAPMQAQAAPSARELALTAEIRCTPEDRLCLLGFMTLLDGMGGELMRSAECENARGPTNCRGEAGEAARHILPRLREVRAIAGRAHEPVSADRAFPRRAPSLSDPRFIAYRDRAMADLERPCNAPEAICLGGKLALLVDVDQLIRATNECADTPSPEQQACMERWSEGLKWIDSRTTVFMERLLATEGWPGRTRYGAGASHNAWLLVQHADDKPDFQRRALVLLRAVVAAGEASGDDLAYLEDRVALKDEKPQVYGTQGSCEGATWTPFPVIEPEKLDERRARVGLPSMANYRQFVAGACGR